MNDYWKEQNRRANKKLREDELTWIFLQLDEVGQAKMLRDAKFLVAHRIIGPIYIRLQTWLYKLRSVIGEA